MKKLTPVIVVVALEPCLPFWTERLGFHITATVPHGDALGFAILQREGVEVMYQSRASVEADVPAMLDLIGEGKTPLFIEVEALAPVMEALEGADVVVPHRKTFYGMEEVFVQAPCGTVVGFAARLPEGD